MSSVRSLKSIWEIRDTTKRGRRNRGCLIDEDEEGSGSNQRACVNFDAVPEEFRPQKQGENLIKVRAKRNSKEKVSSEESLRNEPIKSNVAQRKIFAANFIASPIRNVSCEKETLKIEEPQRVANQISEETGRQKKVCEMFFYNSSTRNELISKVRQNLSGKENGLEKSSEKSKLQDEILYNSSSNRSKATNSNFKQNKDKINFSESNKSAMPTYGNHTASSQNKDYFDIQKSTRETIVTKRIEWKNDLCQFKKPEKLFYEYTETTKESMSYVSSPNEDGKEVRKRSSADFKKERNLCNSFRRCNRKDERFDSIQNAQRKAEKHFDSERHQKPDKKFEESDNCFRCGRNPIIIKHKMEIFHMNGRRGNNRKFQNSLQMIHPSVKDRNASTDSREHCDAAIDQIIKNATTDAVKVIRKTRKSYLSSPLKLADSSSNAEYAKIVVSRTNNNNNTTTLIKYGREISDMIAGSYVAMSTFLDNYEQWKDFRCVTMLLFGELENNLSQSRNRSKRIIEIVEMVGTGCKMAQYVPHTGVSLAAKIVAFLSDVVSRMFSSSNSAKAIGMDEFQLRLCLQEDMNATSDIYLYGMQCDLQFQETRQLIEEFHSEIQNGRYEKVTETFETGFLKEISSLSLKNPDVFYKRLERAYKILKDHQQSEDGKSFCKAFEHWPDALSTISRLCRRFKTEKWDSSSVLKTWEEIYNLLQNDQSVVEDVLKKTQDCICVLMQEQNIMEKYAMDLQKQG